MAMLQAVYVETIFTKFMQYKSKLFWPEIKNTATNHTERKKHKENRKHPFYTNVQINHLFIEHCFNDLVEITF